MCPKLQAVMSAKMKKLIMTKKENREPQATQNLKGTPDKQQSRDSPPNSVE